MGPGPSNPDPRVLAAMGAKEYLVSTAGADSAFGVTGNEKLTA